MMGIYKITNVKNGMIYIGQTTDIKRRWKEHKSKYKYKDNKLYQAMREGGIASHLGEVAMGKRKTAYKYIWKYSFDKSF